MVELTWTDSPSYNGRSSEIVQRFGTFYGCFNSGVWFRIHEQIRPPDAVHLYPTRLQMGGKSCSVRSESYCVGWNSGDDTYLGPEPEMQTIDDLPADAMTVLAPFLDGVSYEYEDGALTLEAAQATTLATTVCAAAEEEVFLGGKSKGRRIGTLTDTQILMMTLCTTIAYVVGVEVPSAIADAVWPPRGRPGDADDLPDQGTGTDTAPPLQTDADGAGGSGNWPSTAKDGDCDDGDVPEDLSRPLDMKTDNLTLEQANELATYARLVNSWLAKNGPARVISTSNTMVVDASGRIRTLRSLATRAANAAKSTARQAGAPFEGKVPGHVPDSALSGEAEPPCGWFAMDSKANSQAGSYLSSRIGQVVTHLTVDGHIP